MIRTLLTRFIAALTMFALPVWAEFDPVREDIDIFMVNPTISGDRPNVLIVLDNTANWNQAFVNEKAALVSVINGITSSFNVGLGMFVETGGSNDNEDGAYVRFAVRQMTGDAKSTLSTMVNNLSELGDKSNNNGIGLAMSEVYKYFSGGTSHSSYGKAKTDYNGNTSNPADALDPATWGKNAFSSAPTSASLFNSPVTDKCQKNFIIYIGNGAFNENATARATASSRLTTAGGNTSQIALTPSGQQENLADEWARFMAEDGFNVTISGQTKKVFVNTYAVAIDPQEQNLWGSGSSAGTNDSLRLMKSMSQDHGKGRYFEVTSASGGSSIVAALTQIFNEIQAVNSVFASTTLPVSVNVRGTNLNQVYIGMFRPDGEKAPRWFGNLKLYKLAATSDRQLFLADANNASAEDPGTGFVGSSNLSFWTSNSNFWVYRDPAENGPGGASDAPDGNLVEKGAVAQKLRTSYASSQSARKLYTCTEGTVSDDCVRCGISGSGSAMTCTGGSALSLTPFATSNDGITAASLDLGTKDVNELTGKVEKTVSSLTDRRPVTLNNSVGASVQATLSNGAVTGTISGLTTALTRSINSLTGLLTTSVGVSTISKSGSVFNVVTSSAHGFSTGDSVVIAGNTVPAYNGTWTISVVNSTTFRIGASGNPGTGTGGTATRSVQTTVAKVNLTNHGFSGGDTVTIAGAAPAGFNGSFGITVVDADNFTYNMSSAQGNATTPGNATGQTTTATATTTAAHGLVAGNQVVVSGASPTGYNITATVLASPAPTTNNFSYTVASKLGPNTASPVSFYKVGSASTTVTGTVTSGGPLTDGVWAVAGPNSCFTSPTATITTTGASTFTYTTSTACTTAPGGAYTLSGTTTGPVVTAILPVHGLSTGTGFTILGTDTNHTGTYVVSTVVDANTFTYSTVATQPVPVGSFTLATSPTVYAYATSSSHGFAEGSTVAISGVDTSVVGNAVYNTTSVTINKIDDNTFRYALAGAAASAATTTSTIKASQNTTTAYASVTNHGFSAGTSVTVTGATPSAFNGTFTISNVTTDSFTYTLPSAQGVASGTIRVSAGGTGSTAERDLLIDWTRGQDNAENENRTAATAATSGTTGVNADCRASVHGDVLHSRPAVFNYNRYAGDNDVYVFYGSNDGVFRAVKGGTANDATDPTTLSPGDEAWGFVPVENFGNLKRLRNNTPVLSPSFKKPYFMDGPIGVRQIDANNDGRFVAADNDLVHLFIGARRGGRYYYSMDVGDPVAPKFRWKIDPGVSGFEELGYTWSQPVVVTGVTGYTNPILVFGGGYDPAVEDIENCTVQAASSTEVRYYSGAIKYTATGCTQSNGSAIAADTTPNVTVPRTMGRAIFVVDAVTGNLIWHAVGEGLCPSGTTSGANATCKEVSRLNYAIAGDPIVVRNESGGPTSRAYFGDTGGNVWRFDFNNIDRSQWRVTRLANLGSNSSPSTRRKFLYPPDVVDMGDYDAVLIGSGDREHPFDMTVTNRFYMIKDRGQDAGPPTGVPIEETAVTGTTVGLYDATTISRTTADGTATEAEKAAAIAAFGAKDGWFITFIGGEKDIGNAVTLNGVVFFNTNVSPMSPEATNDESCESNLGIANAYKIDIATLATEVEEHAGGGFLPSPVHVVVQVDVPHDDGTTTHETIEGVISGTSVSQPEGVTLGGRSRRYWYKEID